MLKEAEGYSEADWQTAVADLFLFGCPAVPRRSTQRPCQGVVLERSGSTNRYIDFMLVGAKGCVHIIEIKKP